MPSNVFPPILAGHPGRGVCPLDNRGEKRPSLFRFADSQRIVSMCVKPVAGQVPEISSVTVAFDWRERLHVGDPARRYLRQKQPPDHRLSNERLAQAMTAVFAEVVIQINNVDILGQAGKVIPILDDWVVAGAPEGAQQGPSGSLSQRGSDAIGRSGGGQVEVVIEADGAVGEIRFDPAWLVRARSRAIAVGVIVAYNHARSQFVPSPVDQIRDAKLLRRIENLASLRNSLVSSVGGGVASSAAETMKFAPIPNESAQPSVPLPPAGYTGSYQPYQPSHQSRQV